MLISSCSDWLDVQPSTEKDRAELIEKADGYMKMLYGTYINLTSTSLYGDNLTYGLLSSLERDYKVALASQSTWSVDYLLLNDDNFRSTYIDPIWNRMYNNIANVNSILSDIDEHKGLFHNGEYEMVAGEAYAERAMMHFDLLRLFAPTYEGNEDATAIPYVTSYEAARNVHKTVGEVMTLVLADLDKAEQLLKAGNDPLINELQVITYKGDKFTANRQYHLNYWAALALKARAYLYKGDKVNALKYSKMIIDESPLTWATEGQISGGDKVFQSELIFALDVPNLADYYEANFQSQKYILSSEGYWGAADDVYTLSKIFEDANDYRYLYLFTTDKRGNANAQPAKYKQETGSSKVMKKPTVPMIRLGEMYLIAAECLAETNPSQAIDLLRQLKRARGYLSADLGIADGSDANAIMTYVNKEMRKETYSEGQYWFFLKRTQSPVPDFGWMGSITLAPSDFVFQIPESEKEYGYIPEPEPVEEETEE